MKKRIKIYFDKVFNWSKHIKELERQCDVESKELAISIDETAKSDQDKRLSEIYSSLLTQSLLLAEIASTLRFFKIMYIVIVTSIPIVFLIVELLR